MRDPQRAALKYSQATKTAQLIYLECIFGEILDISQDGLEIVLVSYANSKLAYAAVICVQ